MLAACAAHCNGQLAFAFLDIERQGVLQKVLVPAQQLLCFGVAHDKIHHFLIQSGLVLQFRHIEGVWQAAHIQHKIGLRRHTKLEPEGHNGETHGIFCPAVFHEQIADALFILGGGEQTGIDGIVCTFLQGL